jgi:hypothetical protein
MPIQVTLNPTTSLRNGAVQRWNVNQTWADIRTGDGNGTGEGNNESHAVYIQAANVVTVGNFKALYRGALGFNTNIGASATIISAVLSLYGSGKNDFLSCTPDVNVYECSPNGDINITSTMYQGAGITALSTTKTYAGWSVTGYNNFTLNAAGLTAINKTGFTWFTLRNVNYDVDAVIPAWIQNQFSELRYWTTVKGANYQPKLVVTYTTGNSIIVELAFNQSIFTDPTDVVWTDISADVREIHTKRGRMHELNRIEAGEATVVVNNTSGNYWRYNTAGTYYIAAGNKEVVKPLTLLRIRSTYDGTTYPLYYGVTESLQPDWVSDRGGKTAIMKINCVDMFKTFSRYFITSTTTPPTQVYASELSGARVNHVLDSMGWPDTATSRAIDAGKVTVSALTPVDTGENSMEHIFDVAKAESGILFIAPNGIVTFQDSDSRWTNFATSSATFTTGTSGNIYIKPEMSDDDTWIYNAAIIETYNANVIGTASNATAITNQGLRLYEEKDTVIQNLQDAKDRALITVVRYADSKMRCSHLEIFPDSSPDDLYPKVLGYDISTRITLQLNNTDNPEALSTTGKQYHIEGIEHDWYAWENKWMAKWQLWDVNQYRLFNLDHSGYTEWYGVDSYANTHDYVGNAYYYNNPPDSANVRVGQSISNVLFPTWWLWRGYVAINTTGYPANINVANAYLRVHTPANYTIDRSFDITITNTGGAPSNGELLNLLDYSNLGVNAVTVYGSLVINTPSLAVNTWLYIPLDTNGVAAINAGNITRFGIKSSQDIASNSPGTNTATEMIYFEGYNTSNPPQLLVITSIA